ncbi:MULTISPECIES: medium chain dehydrogenase/reductase family protein [unclassified Streptomyces]|uniref:medium chain dehydrogenase/reductase family protein n=1 Tax=unclassified Streptomyces TaxID=2593676 RepID=UPI00081D4F1D|nr:MULTISPECIES: medium chain dehydrogenase/reductase family protein [unclassified Streptomyces]MYR29121.1 zinc-binding dehydrogenase [Streptomyces sp. SID4945]SCF44088.1 NADPH:quinone reductase [Streptomyces sp. LcepLS]
MSERARLVEVVLPGVVEPEGLQVREAEAPVPGEGEVVLAMEASGVSFAEQQMRRGRYFDQPPFPFVPGYDVVGRVHEAGPGVDPGLVGRRVAALLKVGGWASRVRVAAADLVPVPEGVSAEEAETVVVNGITAWQMLHRKAKVRAGQTVLVHGASGGVGSVLVQLARAAGVEVIGTASARHHEALRALGVTPVDYHDGEVAARVRELAPGGVAAVFDHVGGPGIVDSWRLLARGGTLVAYGTASTRDDTGSRHWPVIKLFARLGLWQVLPNGRGAGFYNIWAGSRNKARFRAHLRADLTAVLTALARGEITARVAGTFPLARTAEAMSLAESGTVSGKIVLTP